MDFFVKLHTLLDGKMETPGNYGWFHLLFFGIVIVATVLLCVFFKDAKNKTVNLIVLITWLIIVVLEIYKQLNYGFSVEDGKLVWDYQWYAFPFQFCSSVHYVLPFIVFLKEGKIRDAFISFMGAFCLFGGIAVMFYPNDVFISTIGINIQTMIHHGAQVVMGIFLTVHQRNKLGIFHYLKSIPVFAAFSILAIVMNEIAFYSGLQETFNMFYISSHYPCTLPILSQIYEIVPYIVFLLIYLLGFVLVSAIVYFAQLGIIKLVNKIKSKKTC